MYSNLTVTSSGLRFLQCRSRCERVLSLRCGTWSTAGRSPRQCWLSVQMKAAPENACLMASLNSSFLLLYGRCSTAVVPPTRQRYVVVLYNDILQYLTSNWMYSDLSLYPILLKPCSWGAPEAILVLVSARGCLDPVSIVAYALRGRSIPSLLRIRHSFQGTRACWCLMPPRE